MDQSAWPSPPYRTVLSVSRSQSLSRSREVEEDDEEEEREAVAGCWSTASSGTKARLGPLKDIAGSLTSASLTHHLIGGGTDPIGVTGHGSGLGRWGDAGPVPGFGNGPLPGEGA